MSLKKQAFGGVKWTSVSAIVSAAVQVLQIAVLARFLDKKDFGLMAIALFVIGISQIFIDMGMSNSIIHKQQVNRYQLSTLFWLNIFMGWVIFLLLFLSAPLIADFYKTKELKNVIIWISTTFLIVPWGQQFESLLVKELKFKSLSFRDITGRFIGLIVAVVLACYHFGVYALVFANLVASLVSTGLLVYYGFRDYRPKMIFSWRSIKDKGFFSFGLYQMGERILNYFNAQFDTLVIGKLLGMEALGIYNIAKTLALKPYQIINPIITRVAFPVLAKVQNDIQKLKEAYLRIINILTATNAPIYALIIVLAAPLIQTFFGKEWLLATPYLQILSISALCSSIGNPVGSLQLARGRADLGFYWNAGKLLLMPISIWIGSVAYGLIGVAWALAISKIFINMFPVWYFYIKPLCAARFEEYFKSFGLPSLLAIIAGILAFIPVVFIKNIYIIFAVSIAIYIIAYMLISIRFNKGFWKEMKHIGLVNKINNYFYPFFAKV